MVRKTRPSKEWAQLVSEYDASPLSRNAFAKSKRIKPSTFHYWLYKLRRESKAEAGDGEDGEPGFLEVSVAGASSSAKAGANGSVRGAGTIERKVSGSRPVLGDAPALEIVLGTGDKLLFFELPEPAFLDALLSRRGEGCGC